MRSPQPDFANGAAGTPSRFREPLAGPGSVAPVGRPQWSSDQLFGNRHEIEIAHGDSIYRLRVTSLGKLILTK